MTCKLKRRNFLCGSMIASTAVLAGLPSISALANAAEAPKLQRSLSEIYAMSPVQMAEESEVVRVAYRMIQDAIDTIKNRTIRETIAQIIANPAPTVVECLDQKRLLSSLKSQGFVPDNREVAFPPLVNTTVSPQPFYSAPGSGYGSHHAYPGGLCTHVAFNIAVAQSLAQHYRSVSHLFVDYDDLVGGEILHDLHKPWVFQWNEDHSCRTELSLAGTGEHHVLSIAESIKRGLPASFIVAQACAHEHPGSDNGEKIVVGWIRCASLIADCDPIRRGLLSSSGNHLPHPLRTEGFGVHLADHDWVLSGYACQQTVSLLKKIALTQYGIKQPEQFNAFRNYILSQLTALRLYGKFVENGEEAVINEIGRLILC